MNRYLRSLISLFVVAICTLLWAAGEEHFGNDPLIDANYQDWKGIMPVINDTNRVYHVWINGNENFYYRSNTDALNAALRKFSVIGSEVREVILRPGPGVAHPLIRDERILFDWNLHLMGGIAKAILSKDKGDLIWSKHPTMTVYVGGGNVELEKIKVPSGVAVIELSDLRERYMKGLETTDRTLRGWGLGELASLDPYNKDDAEIIAKRLEDSDDWVRLNAVSALASFGKTAEFALLSVQKLLQDPKENVRKSAEETISKIKSAALDPVRVREHKETLARIHEFRKRVGE